MSFEYLIDNAISDQNNCHKTDEKQNFIIVLVNSISKQNSLVV